MAQEPREAWTPAHGTTTPDMSLCRMLFDRSTRDPDGVYAERRTEDGTFEPVTVGQFLRDVVAAARGLIALGVQPGDRVGIMAGTRYEWSVADFAILYAGGVSVPIYQTSSAEQVRWIVADSGVRIVLAETPAMGATVGALIGEGELQRVLVIDDGGLDELRAAGQHVSTAEVKERASAAHLETLATIVYTSGTTGRPKGVELTHGNFLVHIVNGADDPNLGPVVSGPETRTLLFLPLSHVFGRFIALLCVYSGTVLGYAPSTKTLVGDLQAFRPTWLLAVPRVFETLYNSAELLTGGGAKLTLFRWAAKVSQAYSRSLDTGGPSAVLKARHALADRLVLQRIRAVMGGQATYAISGGAPLAVWLGHFYRGLGMTVMEGYGLTELAAPTAVNRPGLIKIGSVGAPYPGTGVRIAEDGEILVQGPNVFRAYRNDPDGTAAAFRDGWFLTGDYGRLDEDGYLHITGRKKEIIVTAGGKNVQPAALENALRAHPIISEVVVIGDDKPFIAALIALDPAMLPGWLKSRGLPELTVAEAAEHPIVRGELDKAVSAANESVSRAESIRSYAVLPRELTEEQGELSASLKVRRKIVLEHFAKQVDGIYG
ncbi:long-chain fatty acid--CoA ligase [Naasia sp. SYSU D00057]|uniref:AMP-dependent synthetase/ligase n=1 Tax=Naasia sp. SYSU D00057 TaxID=2817380 RepID=UPI001FF032EF|nr:AMP-dependent synthetase/ligase [Naasia sp. SYSU D00057]